MSSDSRTPSTGPAPDIGLGVRRLPPAVATLFEMRFARGLSSSEIAEAISRDPAVATAFVERLLKDGFDELADDVGAHGDAARAELARALARPNESNGSNGVPIAVVEKEEPRAEPSVEPPVEPRAPRRRRLPRRALAVGAGGILLLSGGLAALSFAGGDEADGGRDDSSAWRRVSKPEAPKRQSATPAPAARKPRVTPGRVTFRRVEGSSSGRAVARRAGGGTIRLRVSGLPQPGAGSYSLWAYEGRGRTLLLGESERGAFTLAGRLPRGVARFRYLDISLQQPRHGRGRHSGASLLRARLAPLLRKGG